MNLEFFTKRAQELNDLLLKTKQNMISLNEQLLQSTNNYNTILGHVNELNFLINEQNKNKLLEIPNGESNVEELHQASD
jgi:hypothetical protein